MRLYWAPRTRSLRALWALEEIGAPYERVRLDLAAGEQRDAKFHAVNPMEKVPALEDGGTCVAESGAILLYLADKFRDAGLAPALDAPERGRFLQWLFFSGACVEGALIAKFSGAQLPEGSAGYGSFDRVFNVLEEALTPGPYLLGENFTAADVLIASDLHFAINIFKMLPPRDIFTAYLARCQSRPAFLRASQIEADGV